MVGNLLLRGMIVGAVAGLLAFGFARVFGEPAVDHAIALEEAASQAKGEAPEPELVSRDVQAGLGLFTGVVTFGAALGGLFSLAFSFSYGRLTPLGPRGASALLAAVGFVALVLVPGLKFPPTPPAVGSPETIVARTQLFFTMLALSLAAVAVAVAVARRSWRLGAWNASLLGVAVYAALVVLIDLALPGVNEVPEQFPALLLWDFRIASLGMQAILWAGLGLGFGYVAERYLASLRPERRIASAYAAR
ncbi:MULTISPECIES: CbtA family protein [unclassified Xanthobacter]|uniref:CbtA family protein n=1 Tax=unclassified Xanthobacter TaxID=2623496 RepID=UPI001F1CE29F|nr:MULTISPECIES: CbtA family protein [unclassified Xanthobacter]